MTTQPVSPKYRRFTRSRIGLFLAIVLVLVIWNGSQKTPTPAAAGTEFKGALASAPSGDVLRVATFNIDGGVGKADDRLDLDRTAAALKDQDLIALEEVHGGPLPWSDNQAKMLGDKLKVPWLFAPVERRWWHDSFGDAALTSLPVNHWQRFPLANEISNSNRQLLVLGLKFKGRPLTVLITHLERRLDRETELASVISLFNSLQAPVILMGDLNSDTHDGQINALRKAPGVADPIGGALNDKISNTVDWIFARGMHSVKAGLSDNGASDHPLAWCELQLDQ